MPIQFTGPIWNPNYIRNCITQASDETLDKAASFARSLTPVRSGNMASLWESKDGYLSNSAPYSGYVDQGTSRQRGRAILKAAIPQMERDFGVRLARQIH